MMKDLDGYQPSSLTRRDNIDQLTPWFQKLAAFFALSSEQWPNNNE
jgi:hypothetical protein